MSQSQPVLTPVGVRITDATPTGKGALVPGCGITLGLEHGVGANLDIGSGTITALDAYQFGASGAYGFDVLGYKGAGTWSITASSPDNGQTWVASATVTGTWSFSGTSPVSANESGSGTDTTITWSSGTPVVQSFQDDSVFQKAKVFLAFTLDGHDLQLYMYNADVYGA